MPARPSDPVGSPIAGPSHDSSHSSPRPGSEFELNSTQRDQDVQLAASMTQGTRARSSTLADRDRGEMSTPGRGGGRGVAMGTSPPRGENVGGSGRRRGSVGASNALDHLADDLEIHAHQQDIGYFDRGTTSPDNRQGLSERQQQRFVPHSMQQSPSIQHSAAAARFYRQRRNLSDSSIDSQGGAYIDHRRQPHSLASGTPGRGLMASGGSRARGMDGYEGRSMGMGTGTGRTGLRREVSAGDEYEGGQPSRTNRRSRSPPSPSQDRRDEDPSQSGISTRTARQFAAEDLDEDAIIDDDAGRQSPRQHLERHASQKSYMTDSSRHSPEHGDFFPELSRQGSTLGKPEEDVCFPVHSSSVDPDLIDLGLSSMYLDGHEQHRERHAMHEAHGGIGVPGVLHNFPFPFDFGALEEFADREKDGIPIPGARRKADNGGLSTSPPGYGMSSASSRPRMGMSVGTDGAEGRRTMRQRKLSESVAPGRFQRKLALFEGAGDEATSAGRPEGTRGVFQSIMDVKTPLLADKGTAPNGMGGGGYGSGGPGGATTPGTGSARPYRFSFYSNSLPSTIHARSLAEIPAEGQTFEELFVGHRTEYEESIPGLDPRTAFSPSSQAETGTNTPNGASTSRRTSLNGARPAGVPQPGLGATAKKSDRLKGSMMRTEIDAESNTWWLDVLCPTDVEMKVFGIHPLTTEDIQMEETREKIELFRNYYFVCFRSFEQDPYSPTYLEPLNMYIIVFREGTLSFHFRGTPHPQNVRRRIKQLKDYINVTSDWISYALIDDITDAFGPLIQNIEYEVDSIDELVLILKEAEQSDMLRRIGTCRKKVMGLLRLMGNKADVVKGLSKRCNENWSVAPKSDIGLYLSDIQDHITTSTQNLTHYEKILSRSHSNYLAQISIEMTDANNQINDVLSKLTALGTVLIPMNLITGLWGMNVHVPGQEVENLHWFFSIIGCLGGIALGGAWLTYRVFVKP